MKEKEKYEFSEEDYVQNHEEVCHVKDVYTFKKYTPIEELLEILEKIKKDWEGMDAEFCFNFCNYEVVLSAKYWEPETKEQFINRKKNEILKRQKEIEHMKVLMLNYPESAKDFIKYLDKN